MTDGATNRPGRISGRLKNYLYSLRARFFAVLIIAVIIGMSIYFVSRFAAYSYINTVYTAEENRKEREIEYIKDLQDFAIKNKISSDNTGKLSRWAKENRYVYLLVYKDDQLFYTSDDEPETEEGLGEGEKPSLDEKPDSSEGENSTAQKPPSENKEDSSNSENDNPGGVTVDYPTREELFEYAQKNELHPLELTDGTMLASITEFTEYLYYDIANIVSLAAAVLFVVAMISLYFQKVTGRIIRLGEDVNKVAEGDMAHKISAKGKDEISKLSFHVDDMRNAIIENLRKEQEALDSNTALITSMSHDIRTPLTVLLGYLDVMREKCSDDSEMQSYLSRAESTAMRLKKLSDDLFNYFLVFGGRELEINMESYSAATLIDQMLSEHILLMSESGYDVSMTGFDFADFTDVKIKTDAHKLVRIFDNVFQNIYKYTDKAYPVSIFVKKTESCAEVSFKNYILRDTDKAESNGIGIKTCKKLGEYINVGFSHCADEDWFTVSLTLPFDK